MTPDERVAEAIADLEGLLAEGLEITAAISESASLYGIGPDVLRLRAEKKLGDLQAVCDRYSRLRIRNDRERRLKKTVQEYVDTFFNEHPKSQLPFVPINNWIRKEFGNDTRERDIAFATARVQMAFHNKVIRDLNAKN